MKKQVQNSIFHAEQPAEPEDKSQPPMTQLTRIPLPDNFASTQQVRTLLNYVNGESLPAVKDDFKELGHGQFGVVYQVRLPEVDLVAAKLLPDTIRNTERRRDKRKKSDAQGWQTCQYCFIAESCLSRNKIQILNHRWIDT